MHTYAVLGAKEVGNDNECQWPPPGAALQATLLAAASLACPSTPVLYDVGAVRVRVVQDSGWWVSKVWVWEWM